MERRRLRVPQVGLKYLLERLHGADADAEAARVLTVMKRDIEGAEYDALPAAWRVTLSPGDALFLPAFWLHHVVSVDAAVSLNVFSESPIKLAAAHGLAQLATAAHQMAGGPLRVQPFAYTPLAQALAADALAS